MCKPVQRGQAQWSKPNDNCRVQHDRVLGVDACGAGWIGISPGDTGVAAYVAADLEALVARADSDGRVSVVAVDIPIGLPDRGRRRADILARARLGPRRSSLFITPVRDALAA